MEVLVISRRPEIGAGLARLLGNLPVNRSIRLERPGRRCVAAQFPFAMLDVITLFPEQECGTALPARILELVVVGLRGHADALTAAVGAGIPVYILEDLQPATVARLLPGSPQRREPYGSFTRLAADRVRSLLEMRVRRRGLTPRERAILQLLVKGATNAEIASALCIELKTVKNHLTRLFDKMEVSSRLEAMARYLETESATLEPAEDAR